MTAGCTLGVVAVGVLGLGIGSTHELDATIMHGLTGLVPDRLYERIRVVALIVNPVPYTCMGLVCIAVALVRHRPARALAAGVVLLGSSATTQVIKHVLAEPRYAAWLYGGQIDGGSWPSGHGTAVMSVALSAVLVAPPTHRAAVALAGFFCTVVLAYTTVGLTWHYPSDVVAGFLIAGLWASLASVWLQRIEAENPGPDTLWPSNWLVAIGTGGVVVATTVVWLASSRVGIDVTDRVATVGGALGIAALSLSLTVATVVAASEHIVRKRPRPIAPAGRATPRDPVPGHPTSGTRSSSRA